MERCRYWLVRVSESVVGDMMGLLPKSAEAWRVSGSRSAGLIGQASVECVLRYPNPVSQRWVSKLPVISVMAWKCDVHDLADRTRYLKLKYQDEATIKFFRQFRTNQN